MTRRSITPPAGPVSTTVVFDLVSSPAGGVAQTVGRGAASTDLVTVDGLLDLPG
jgi:hypothetical protein